MIAVIDYGAGNTASVGFALDRAGAKYKISSDAAFILKADKVILPGVGHAKSALSNLKAQGLLELIPSLSQPVLGICLGLQLLCCGTEESGTKGMNLFQTKVLRFSESMRVPHMGWNSVYGQGPLFDGIAPGSPFYFVHSYYAEQNFQTIASTQYGNSFAAALQEKNFFATQFHPEKSGEAGAKLLQNFIEL